MIGKFQLKKMMYDICDAMDRDVGKMMSPACQDEETGKLRSQAYTEMMKCAEKIKEIADGIY